MKRRGGSFGFVNVRTAVSNGQMERRFGRRTTMPPDPTTPPPHDLTIFLKPSSKHTAECRLDLTLRSAVAVAAASSSQSQVFPLPQHSN
ncbi:hypothetical protein FCV25MIE_24018 [Fagus crenata]